MGWVLFVCGAIGFVYGVLTISWLITIIGGVVAGLDVMTIKDLGRWESLEMVQRYTRSVTFNDSLKFYKAPLS